MLSIKRISPACTAMQPWMRGVVPSGDLLHRPCVDRLVIDDLQQRVALHLGRDPRLELGRCHLLRFGHCGVQRGVDVRRCGPVRCVEQRVARREGQPVFAADDRAFDDLDGERQLGHHRLDDGDLLEILFPEIGACRAHDVEQAADDLRYAVEMAGARGALHHLVDQSEIELPAVGLGIYLLDRGHQHEIRPGLFQQAGISLRRAGVMLQVVLSLNCVGFTKTLTTTVPFSRRARSTSERCPACRAPIVGTKADSRLLRLVQLCTELLDTFKYFHPFLMRVVRAKVEIPSDITKKKSRKNKPYLFLMRTMPFRNPGFPASEADAVL